MKRNRTSLTFLFLSIVVVFITSCTYNAPDKNKPTYNDFELNLYSDQTTYNTTDKIKIWATIKYIGKDKTAKIWHGDPYINFQISDGKSFDISGVTNTILASTVLDRNKLYTIDYVKSGTYSENDIDVDKWKKFYAEKDLYLPQGEYKITIRGTFFLNKELKDINPLSKEIKITVK
jgi:hypothetical protein